MMKTFPVVAVTGPRQAGKTTLVRSLPLADSRRYVTFDDLESLDRARRDPHGLVEGGEPLTLDEVQRVPDLLLAIKMAVDTRRRPGQFLLTGSANLLLMRQIAESLTGRAVYLHLWPLTESEKKGQPDPGPWSELLTAEDATAALTLLRKRSSHEGKKETHILTGGYPRAALADDDASRTAWFDGYVTTYLERDLREVSAISALPDFRRLMGLAAHRVGQILNQAELGRDAALPQPTAHRYLNLLETTFQIVRIPPYASRGTKRLVKAPKVYWCDPGLAAHLAGLPTAAAVRSSSIYGALVENHVLLHLLAWRETATPRPQILHWRNASGAEVDFLIEAFPRLLPVEVKATRRLSSADGRSMEAFFAEHGRSSPFGLILHDGLEAYRFSPRIVAAPFSLLFGA
ncbi:MAG: ATP-binding protein [Planctomycetes bacterium]|nr:ATP-binding protein [Planctomycetota bacterium]